MSGYSGANFNSDKNRVLEDIWISNIVLFESESAVT